MDKQTKLPTPGESQQHYSVPEGYFEHLEERIMARIPEIPAQAEPPRPSLWVRMRPIVYLAAAMVSLNLIFRAFHSATRPETETQQIATTEATSQDEAYSTYYAEYGGQVAAQDADESLFADGAGLISATYSSSY